MSNFATLWGKISASHCDKKCGADIAAKNIIIIPHFGKIGPAVLAQFIPKCGIILILFPQCQYNIFCAM